MYPLEEDMEIWVDGCGVMAIGSVGKGVGVRAGSQMLGAMLLEW